MENIKQFIEQFIQAEYDCNRTEYIPAITDEEFNVLLDKLQSFHHPNTSNAEMRGIAAENLKYFTAEQIKAFEKNSIDAIPRTLFQIKHYENPVLGDALKRIGQYFYVATEEIVQKLGNFKPVFIEYDEKYLEGPHPFGDKFRDGTFTYSVEGVLHQMKNIIKRFPKLFPDMDLTYFKEKCDALEKAMNQ